MIFGNELLSLFLILGFFKCLCCRWTQRSRSNFEYIQLKFGSPLRHPFLTLILHQCVRFDP